MAIANCDIVDLSAAAPSYNPTGPLHYGRTRLNAVLLPDRTVFVSGGGSQPEGGPVLQSEIYDPGMGTWTVTATAAVPRFYHSVALLLPDGRVATAGSNPDRGDDELRIEIFHPPYLFRGQRPFIERFATEVHYGSRHTLGDDQRPAQPGPARLVDAHHRRRPGHPLGGSLGSPHSQIREDVWPSPR